MKERERDQRERYRREGVIGEKASHGRASFRRSPSSLTCEIKINGDVEGFFLCPQVTIFLLMRYINSNRTTEKYKPLINASTVITSGWEELVSGAHWTKDYRCNL